MRADRARAARRRGFTLLEIVVAIAVGSLVVLGARLMLGAVADAARATRAAARVADRAANADALLRGLVLELEVGTAESGSFAGDTTAARFSTWCPVAGGWVEQCRATLAVERSGAARPGDGHALVATLSTGERLEIRAGLARAELRYLSDASGGGRWFRVWAERVSAPLAIGVIVDSAGRTDTLVLRIGERG